MRLTSPPFSAFSSLILKPAIRGFDDHELDGHLCLDAAGINEVGHGPSGLFRGHVAPEERGDVGGWRTAPVP